MIQLFISQGREICPDGLILRDLTFFESPKNPIDTPQTFLQVGREGGDTLSLGLKNLFYKGEDGCSR